MSPEFLSTSSPPIMFINALRASPLLLVIALLPARSFTPAFIENRGQWHADARYRLQLDGLTMWITDRGAVYDLQERVAPAFVIPPFERFDAMQEGVMWPSDEPLHVRGHLLRVEFVGASESAEAIGGEVMSGRINYFIGDDEKRWGRNCQIHESARIIDLYDGIDAIYYLDEGVPRYDLIVAPGADPSRIAMRMRGADDVRIEEGGRLAVGTSLGDLEMHDLVAYQINGKGERCQITSRFRLRDGLVSFEVGAYDRSRPLVIDPIVYSTYVGGTSPDVAMGIAVDGDGNAYITGYTHAQNRQEIFYPTTVGAYDTTHGEIGDDHLFVTKLSADGSSLLYSTYLGGSLNAVPGGIAVDGEGHAYLAGTTLGRGYPTTDGAYDTSANGATDIFVTKLSADGSSLLYSTIIGSETSEEIGGIVIDGEGNAFIAGSTKGARGGVGFPYPTTPGVFRSAARGDFDAFITKLSADGSSVIYSTVFGSTELDRIDAIAIDSSGSAYITGLTSHVATTLGHYPATSGAFDTSQNGKTDIVVTKLSPDGTTLLYSTFIGGGGNEGGNDIAVDTDGAAYIVGGISWPALYPTTPGAFMPSGVQALDLVVTKLTPDGAALAYSTFIAGKGNDFGYAITVDVAGRATLAGFTTQTKVTANNYPTTEGNPMLGDGTSTDILLTTVSADGSDLLYSVVFGGSSEDRTYAVAVDAAGNAYLAGSTYPVRSGLYPTTEGAYSRTYQGSYEDVVVTKIALTVSDVPSGRTGWNTRLDLK